MIFLLYKIIILPFHLVNCYLFICFVHFCFILSTSDKLFIIITLYVVLVNTTNGHIYMSDWPFTKHSRRFVMFVSLCVYLSIFVLNVCLCPVLYWAFSNYHQLTLLTVVFVRITLLSLFLFFSFPSLVSLILTHMQVFFHSFTH